MNFPKLYECDPQKNTECNKPELRKSVYAHYAEKSSLGSRQRE